MDIKTFLSAFYSENDEVYIRAFSDRKAEVPEYKGNKYTEKLKNIDVLLPTLKQHNKKPTSQSFDFWSNFWGSVHLS